MLLTSRKSLQTTGGRAPTAADICFLKRVLDCGDTAVEGRLVVCARGLRQNKGLIRPIKALYGLIRSYMVLQGLIRFYKVVYGFIRLCMLTRLHKVL